MSETPDLHERLAADCIVVGRFELCWLLLMNDANYPWFILVPDRAGVVELHDLVDADQVRLIRESTRLSRLLAERCRADKINVAALGNIVPQLHLHHVARYHGDPAWPAPIWGRVPARPYAEHELRALLRRIESALRRDFAFTDRAQQLLHGADDGAPTDTPVS